MAIIGTRRTHYQIRLYNVADGSYSADTEIFSYIQSPLGVVLHGVETDGEFAYTLHNQGAGDRIRKYALNSTGDDFIQIEQATPFNNNLIDRCYDGQFWWGLYSGNFKKFPDWKFSGLFGPTQSHGLSGAQGIFFDGEKIGIVAT